jgi:diguanylate cyclase (GGDEF)-like protein/PAS domain S-box-containing protein
MSAQPDPRADRPWAHVADPPATPDPADLGTLAALFACAPVAIYEVALDGSVLRWNPASVEMFGWSEAEALGKRLPFISDENAEEYRELVHMIVTGPPVRGRRVQRQRKDGTSIDLDIATSAVRDASGEVVSLIALAQDISSQAAFEADLLATARGFSELFNAAPLAIYELDLEGLVVGWNPAAERIFGWPAAEVLGNPLPGVPDDARAAEVALNARAAAGEAFTGERVSWLRCDGSPVAVSLAAAPVRDGAGQIQRLMYVAGDVTEIAQAESQLRFQAHLLDEVPIAVVATDRDGRVTQWNACAAELTGCPPEDAVGRNLLQMLGAQVDGEGPPAGIVRAIVSGERWQGELELDGGSDGPLPVMGSLRPLRDASGAPDGVLFVASDLRERKSAEAAVRASNEQVELILGRITDAFFALDADETFTYVNEEAARQLKRRRTELLGRRIFDVLDELGASVFEGELRRAFRQQAPVFVEEFFPALDAWLSVHVYPSRGGLSVYFQDVTARKQAEEQIAWLAYNDELTGLPNRSLFTEQLDQAIARARRAQGHVAVLYVDLDDFKLVNDSLGHAIGDELLQLLAVRLRNATRDTDVLARQGGDEFLLLLQDLDDEGETPAQRAGRVAQRIQDMLDEPFVLGGVELFASASVGVSLFPVDADDADSLLKHADSAMYDAKRDGRGCWRAYETSGSDPFAQLSLASRLRRAIDRDEFVLHWQPIIDLATGAATGAEALIRWEDPERGLVLPGEFISLAEHTGMIEPIGDWVVQEFCRQSREWARLGLSLSTEFNLSLRQLWQPNIVQRLVSAVDAAHLEPSTVVIEVTESAAMRDPERALRTLRDLAAHGLKLAIDDFGTGYSSLSRLTQMPVDFVKIDRSFVMDVEHEHSARTMVALLLQLADSLGLTAIAEGIETTPQWTFLVDRGCQRGQGFLFGRPMPAGDLTALVRSQPAA